MFNKQNATKITVFVSLGVMSLVLLITSSIWMHYFDSSIGSAINAVAANSSSTQGVPEIIKTRAIVSLVFIVFGIVVAGISAFIAKKNGFSKFILGLVSAAFVLFLIGAAVPMNDQNQMYKSMSNMPSNAIAAMNLMFPAMVNAGRIFPAAITFLIVPGVTFLGSAFLVTRQELLF